MGSEVLPVLLESAEMVGLSAEETCFTACVLLENPKAANAEHLLMALSAIERPITSTPKNTQWEPRHCSESSACALASALVPNSSPGSTASMQFEPSAGLRALQSFEQHRQQQK